MCENSALGSVQNKPTQHININITQEICYVCNVTKEIYLVYVTVYNMVKTQDYPRNLKRYRHITNYPARPTTWSEIWM